MNFNYISNSSELSKTLNSILEKVINAVSEQLLKDFRDHLDETIYAAPGGSYHRYYDKGGFYSGWDIDKSDRLVRTLIFNGDKLIHPSDDKINDFEVTGLAHGGEFPGTEDYRYSMDAILNVYPFNKEFSRTGGALYLTQVGHGYWDTYLATIDEKIEKWLDEEFKKYGISRR